MKINRKLLQVFVSIFLIFFIVLPNLNFAETKKDLVIFWLVDKKEMKKIGEYRYLLTFLEKNPELCLNFSFSPRVLQTWITAAPDLIEKLKKLREKKQVNVVLPPFSEPVLPLLYDYNPVVNFSYPNDIREQIVSSWELYQQIFGSLPNGMLPPAGAISTATLELLSEFEIKWILTGCQKDEEEKYLPFAQYLTEQGKEIYLFYRENNLSEYWEKISFPEDYSLKISFAKEKIRGWITEIKQKNYPLTVITFEEIEFFSFSPEKKKEILEQLLEEITQGDLVTYTAENYILKSRSVSVRKIEHFEPCTWGKEGFSLWTGKVEKKAAWELLQKTRLAVENYKNSGQAEIKILDKVLEEIYLSEAGNNFIRLGESTDLESEKEVITSNELLFRLRLINIYRLIGQPIPEELFHPLGNYSFPDSLVSLEETKIETNENEKLFSIIDLEGDSLNPDFDLKSFAVQEKNPAVGGEEIIFTFAFSQPVISTGIPVSEVDISELISSTETLTSGDTVFYTVEFSSPEVVTSTEVETEKKRVHLDLYIDLNNLVGAGSVTLLPGRNALTVPEDAWEYCLNIEINSSEEVITSEVITSKEAKMYRAKENSLPLELGKFPLIVGNDNSTFSVTVPKEILYGNPMNWGYIVLLVEEVISKETTTLPVTNLEKTRIIDLIVPPKKTQKQFLSENILNPQLSAVRIK